MSTEFSGQDRAIAGKALVAYMAQLDQPSGLRWMFDYQPDSGTDRIIDRAENHVRHLRSFNRLLTEFGEMIEQIARFENRPPITTRQGLRRIQASDLQALRRMHQALQDYARILGQHAPSDPKVVEAAQAVASVISPQQWEAAGYRVPQDAQPYAKFTIRPYLEAVVRS